MSEPMSIHVHATVIRCAVDLYTHWAHGYATAPHHRYGCTGVETDGKHDLRR